MIQRKFKIATAPSRKSQAWRNEEWTWEKLVTRLSTPKDTGEKYGDYMRAAKEEQSNIKDVGGFVGGYLRGGRRLMANLVSRSMLTLDVDFGNGTSGFNAWEVFKLNYNCAACMYTTHKHSGKNPRYRIVIPLNQDITPDMYGALSRFVAENLGIEDFDDSTYEPHRLMYWPSRATDGEFYAEAWPPTRDFSELTDASLMDPECELAYHDNWEDVSTWPVSSRTQGELRKESRLAGDPREKPNPIGAFCRAYDIPAAIAAFLPDVYTPAGENRYTYAKGSSACGLTLMDDGQICYSHHSTDPANGGARNSFDLVRIHLFGHLDNDCEDGCAITRLPSYAAMGDFARTDRAVKSILIEDLSKEFAAEAPAPAKAESPSEGNPSEEKPSDGNPDGWKEKLELGKGNQVKATYYNIELILENDPALKGAFAVNQFTGKTVILTGRLPWRAVPPGDCCHRDVDDSGLRAYFENKYGIVSREKINDVFALVSEHHGFHPVREYLDSLKWDGVHRVDSLLIDYLGADDNAYVRSVTRKTLLGAVSRVRRPGCKFDNVLTLVGGQGIGKSTLVHKLARQWFSDSLNNVQGKEAYEQIQGFWIIELGELASLKKAELESIKQFLSKSEDSFRAAYAHRTETHKRQCIFIGTTNTYAFLRDPSGNRRFWPVDVHRGKTLTVMDDLTPAVVDQIWAEAQHLFDSAEEPLYLNAREENQARNVQEEHTETDIRCGLLQDWLDTLIPEGFDGMPAYERANYYSNMDFSSPTSGVRRDSVAVIEIARECFHEMQDGRSRQTSNEIVAMLEKLGWTRGGQKRFKAYGPQNIFRRPVE